MKFRQNIQCIIKIFTLTCFDKRKIATLFTILNIKIKLSKIYLSSFVKFLFFLAESKSDRPPIRAFSRRFVTVPHGAGYVTLLNM